MPDMKQNVRLKVRRQDNPRSLPYWDEFEVPYVERMNIVTCLMSILRNPVNVRGEKVAPVVWECNCLEEVCGACTMVINGRVQQSCSALVDQFEQPITLEPMTKFPVIRDLAVDRGAMFEMLKKVHAWIEIDGSHNMGPGPKQDPNKSLKAYEFSRCMTCGCCCEACPQFNSHSPFIGAFAFGQVRLFNSHPTGRFNSSERLDSIMEMGGLADCGNVQNCFRACPKEIPLTDAIADLGWATTKRMVTKFLKE
ncbi:MAG: succinate dehydrogenase iron-sulfur subunit [Deltaproteobacteria bacterium CG11_big_fil_rev_8_21_14_0_20_49_13]|nr:MAG: succinate dehydrogenase iron-sulfur subunit [Deltaproteobacteria bacterium CG11_big_fil_rev_8_21_14_0_20_49_13]